MTPLVIYLPYGGCTPEQEAQLRLRYPHARFVGRWEDGAVMWQDAI